MREATPEEVKRWDELILANPGGGQMLQSKAWGQFKARHGFKPRYLFFDKQKTAVLFLTRRISLFGELWYAPKGPDIKTSADFAAIARQLAAAREPFLIKMEPEILAEEANRRRLRTAGLIKSPRDIQMSRATIILNLRPDADSLLASFKPKTRYNIRLAIKKGVTVKPVPANQANLDKMYRLMAATGTRAAFYVRSKKYFQDYWRLQTRAGQGQLVFAYFGRQLLAGAFITYLGGKAWYKDGGSVRTHRELMAPYLLHWEIMRWLKAQGIEQYDLVAVPPRKQLNASHPLQNLYQFKSGFKSEISEFIGAWDLPLKSNYRLWYRIGERAADAILRRVKKDLLY